MLELRVRVIRERVGDVAKPGHCPSSLSVAINNTVIRSLERKGLILPYSLHTIITGTEARSSK